MVGLTTINGDQEVTVGGLRSGTYDDAVTGRRVSTRDGGLISLLVRANSAGIHVLNGSEKIGVDGAYLRLAMGCWRRAERSGFV